MTTKDDDTDPSTPSARRSSRPAAPPRVEGTDPGVGDPVTEPIAVPKRPLGIIVPAPGATMTPTPPPTAAQQGALKNKDSVEILLDGMTDQRLERTRTTPQSDGQASASYHSAHTLHAAERGVGEEVPKVLLDRPLTPTTVSPRPSPAPPRRAIASSTAPPPPPRLAARVAVAAALGLLVAGVIFLWLETEVKPIAVEPGDKPATAGVVSAIMGGASPSAVNTASPAASAMAPGTEQAPSAPATSAAASAPPPAIETASSARSHAASPPAASAGKHKVKAAPASSADLGEFRTNF